MIVKRGYEFAAVMSFFLILLIELAMRVFAHFIVSGL